MSDKVHNSSTQYVSYKTAPLTHIYGPRAFIPIKKTVPSAPGFYKRIAVAGFLVCFDVMVL